MHEYFFYIFFLLFNILQTKIQPCNQQGRQLVEVTYSYCPLVLGCQNVVGIREQFYRPQHNNTLTVILSSCSECLSTLHVEKIDRCYKVG